MSSHDPNATPAVAIPAEHARQHDPVTAAKSAGNDALAVFRELVTDPFAALAHASSAAPQAKVGMAGVFAAVFILCSAVAAGGMLALLGGGVGGMLAAAFGGAGTLMLKSGIIGIGALAGAVGGIALSRSVFRGRGDPVTDLLAAGIALLPYSLVLLVTRFVSVGGLGLALLVVAMSFASILFFAHLENAGVQKRQALWSTGIVWIAFGIATQIVSRIVF